MPASANSKNPNGRTPYSAAASDTITFTGVPVSASMRPGVGAEHERHQQLSTATGRAARDHHDTGSSAATAPLTLISAVRPATSSIISTSSRGPAVPARAIELLARPGRDAGRVERPR